MNKFRIKGTKQETGLRELIARAPKGLVVELGSAYGESAVLFAETHDVVCIDVWNGVTADREKEFDLLTKPFKNIRKIKGNSITSAELFEDASIDGLYIDSKHIYDHCIQEINAWLPKIKKGGFISGHDYTYKFIGVIQAVHEKFDRPDYTFPDGSWLKLL